MTGVQTCALPICFPVTIIIGVIDYKSGVVTINNFQPVSVSDPFGTLVVYATPAKKVFTSVQNQIITMDLTDPGSVSTIINPVVG